jgi:2-keto-4-pentenoate hydratase/2-oxohepta-3-ene-1,7-dioic acid hydratase in catechol pathway
MKLQRIGPVGAERPAVLEPDGTVRDASAVTADYDSAFFAAGGLEELREALRSSPDRLPAISAGVGTGPRPLRFLRAGDVVELEIEGLGRQRQTCADA